jgi:hypothetical protein
MNASDAAMALRGGGSFMTWKPGTVIWAEHQRQHERQTQADRELEQRLRSHVVRDPEVHHLIFVQSKK